MFRKVLILTTIVLVFPASNLQAVQIPVSWDGGGDGQSWGDANNWDPNILPDNNASQTFAVTINGGTGEAKHVQLFSDRTVDQLDSYGNVWLERVPPSDITLTLAGLNAFTNHGNLRLRGRGAEAHEFTIGGTLKNEPTAVLELFRVHLSGILYNSSGATAEVMYVNEFSSGVQNDGIATIYPAAEMSADANFVNGGQIQIFSGTCATTKVLHNDVNGIIDGFGVVHSGQRTQNEGAIYSSAGSLMLHTDSFLTNTGTLSNRPSASLHIKPVADVNNNGTIEVNAGGGVTCDCNLVNDTNGVIELRGGTLAATTITQTSDANFAGFGSITGDVFIDPNGLIELTGSSNIVGNVNIGTGATLEISDGQTLITGHTTCDGTIRLIGGTVIFQGGCDCNDCNIINEAGLYRNHFDINADGTVNLRDFAGFANTWLWQATWY